MFRHEKSHSEYSMNTRKVSGNILWYINSIQMFHYSLVRNILELKIQLRTKITENVQTVFLGEMITQSSAEMH